MNEINVLVFIHCLSYKLYTHNHNHIQFHYVRHVMHLQNKLMYLNHIDLHNHTNCVVLRLYDLFRAIKIKIQ